MVKKTTTYTTSTTIPTHAERLAEARRVHHEREVEYHDAEGRVRELETRADDGEDVSAADLIEARTAAEIAARRLKPAKASLADLEQEQRQDQWAEQRYGVPAAVHQAQLAVTHAEHHLTSARDAWRERGQAAAVRRRDAAQDDARNALNRGLDGIDYDVLKARLSKAEGEARAGELRAKFDAAHAEAQEAYREEVTAYKYRLGKAEERVALAKAALDEFTVSGGAR
ncbi:hypothetical protein [Isoptericola sp. NPDC019482]|uniref:hypothetical protein n=1 Tax=Isoptericola sp. NPDC019482 TaxID=3154688 RepID=UPI00347C3A4A